MGKTVSPSKKMEWKGLDRISVIVHDMGNIWREMSKDDFGLDGEIEIVTPKPDGKGYETTGGIVKVQAKAGESYIKFDSKTSFTAPVDYNDLKYWQSCTFPVLFVVYHPADDKLYFKEVKQYLKTTPDAFKKPYSIGFNKAKDEFKKASGVKVCEHAGVAPPRITFGNKERFFSNLLPVRRLPPVIYQASTRRQSSDSIRDAIEGFVPPFCIPDRTRTIYSFSDLENEECSLNPFCTGRFASTPTTEWLADGEHMGDFVYMFNQLLGKHLRRCGVHYHKDFGRSYFPREDAQALEFKREWTSLRTSITDERTVAKYYEYGLDKFWRHHAAEFRFLCLDAAWYLQIHPMYFFTVDGETPCSGELAGPYTTSQKALDKNNHVLNHVLFWCDVLSRRTKTIDLQLDGQTIMSIAKEPLTGIGTFAIPEDPALYKEETTPEQLLLFNTDEEGDEDDEY